MLPLNVIDGDAIPAAVGKSSFPVSVIRTRSVPPDCTLKSDVGVSVPIPTFPVDLSTIKFEPTRKPPDIVLVAFVLVALKLPNVGVDVATISPDEFVDRSELMATEERVVFPVTDSPPFNV